MQITTTEARNVFVALGVETAAKWQPKRLTDKLAKIKDLVDDDTNLEGAVDETLTKVLTAIENEEAIEVVKDAPAAGAAAPADAPPAKAQTPAEKKAAKKAADAKTKADKKAKDDAAKKKAKDDAAKKKAKDDAPHGVRHTESRLYFAGQIIKRVGLKPGVTDEMVAELDELCGKANPIESRGRLRSAWHAINGYTRKTKPAAE